MLTSLWFFLHLEKCFCKTETSFRFFKSPRINNRCDDSSEWGLNKVGNYFLLFSFLNFFCCDVLWVGEVRNSPTVRGTQPDGFVSRFSRFVSRQDITTYHGNRVWYRYLVGQFLDDRENLSKDFTSIKRPFFCFS